MANENRLVQTDDVMSFLCKRCNEMYPDEPCEPSDCLMLEELDKCKTVDAVEVVRCKDCVSYEERCTGFGYCYHWDYEPGMSPNQVDADDFCSCGERKDNDG